MTDFVDAIFIAVGTELSTGQIVNTNSAWLAQQLAELGFESMLHWTVPDDRALILQALQQAHAQSRCILISGGLGPTSDDFTRELVAEHLQLPLIFSEASWARLEARAQSSGWTLTGSQKQQCWFPQDAEILINPVGTADAFVAQSAGHYFFVLPGPPSEIKALWTEGLKAAMQPLLPELPETQLYIWQCLGIPEGTLGEYVDSALADENVQVGYRAHFPYIEVKVWIPQKTSAGPIIAKVEQALSAGTVLTGQEDGARRFLHSLPPESEVVIYDLATGGALAQCLQKAWPTLSTETGIKINLNSAWEQNEHDPQLAMAQLAEETCAPHKMLLTIGGINSSGEWSLGFKQFESLHFERFKLPHRRNSLLQQRYVAELALIHWEKWLYAEENN